MHDDTPLITAEEAMERLGQTFQDMMNYHNDNKIIVASHDEIDELWEELKRSPEDNILTEEQFAALSWAEIKALAEECAAGDKSDFEYLLGYGKKETINYKPYNTSPVYTYEVTFRIKGLNNMKKSNGEYAGFYVEADELIDKSEIGDPEMGAKGQTWSGHDWDPDNIGEYYFNPLAYYYDSLPSDLKQIVEEVSVEYVDYDDRSQLHPNFDYNVISTAKNYIFTPSYMNLTGSDQYGKEGEQFDWYKIHPLENDRIKIQVDTNTPQDWWLRTPIQEERGYGIYSSRWNVTTSGTLSTTEFGSRSLYVPFCFCI